VRIISDLIDKWEEEDIPCLLMLVDFEKAFDTVEWPFIEKKTLNFMALIQHYTDISSAVINNCHLSEVFLLERGPNKWSVISLPFQPCVGTSECSP
jgi:hypothetical protein